MEYPDPEQVIARAAAAHASGETWRAVQYAAAAIELGGLMSGSHVYDAANVVRAVFSKRSSVERQLLTDELDRLTDILWIVGNSAGALFGYVAEGKSLVLEMERQDKVLNILYSAHESQKWLDVLRCAGTLTRQRWLATVRQYEVHYAPEHWSRIEATTAAFNANAPEWANELGEELSAIATACFVHPGKLDRVLGLFAGAVMLNFARNDARGLLLTNGVCTEVGPEYLSFHELEPDHEFVGPIFFYGDKATFYQLEPIPGASWLPLKSRQHGIVSRFYRERGASLDPSPAGPNVRLN